MPDRHLSATLLLKTSTDDNLVNFFIAESPLQLDDSLMFQLNFHFSSIVRTCSEIGWATKQELGGGCGSGVSVTGDRENAQKQDA